MAAPKGNKFWQQRSKHMPEKTFTDGQIVLEALNDYFVWVEANPLKEQKIGFFQGTATKEYVEKARVATLGGFCLFLGITPITWSRHRKDGTEDVRDACVAAENAIREQKFAGAAADLFNANLIARDLGLKDTVANEHTSPDGSMGSTKQPLSDDELKKELELRGLPTSILEE